MSENLIKKIQENIFHYKLFARGTRIVVAVSGGPDSVCLLDILNKLKNKYELEIIVAHVNYGLRGKDSEKDEKFVRELAKKYNLPIEIFRATRYPLPATNLENNLRNIRYQYFETVLKKHKTNLIAVGHNLNDQAETVLMRIMRGTGLRGLGAIKFRNANIIRPLLNIPKKEILSYLRMNKITFRIDKTNHGSDFTRNKIRNQLLPHLEKNFNPKIQEILYKLSLSVADDYGFIRKFASEWLESKKRLSAKELKNLHPAVRREAIRLALEKFSPNLQEIESAHIEEIEKIIGSNKSKRQKISFKGLKIERKGDKLIISKS